MRDHVSINVHLRDTCNPAAKHGRHLDCSVAAQKGFHKKLSHGDKSVRLKLDVLDHRPPVGAQEAGIGVKLAARYAAMHHRRSLAQKQTPGNDVLNSPLRVIWRADSDIGFFALHRFEEFRNFQRIEGAIRVDSAQDLSRSTLKTGPHRGPGSSVCSVLQYPYIREARKIGPDSTDRLIPTAIIHEDALQLILGQQPLS